MEESLKTESFMSIIIYSTSLQSPVSSGYRGKLLSRAHFCIKMQAFMICLLSPLENLQLTVQPCETVQKYLFWFLPLLVYGLFDFEENLAGEVKWADAAFKISYIIFITHIEPFSEGAFKAFGCSHVIQSLLQSVFNPMQGHELSHMGSTLKLILAQIYQRLVSNLKLQIHWSTHFGTAAKVWCGVENWYAQQIGNDVI